MTGGWHIRRDGKNSLMMARMVASTLGKVYHTNTTFPLIPMRFHSLAVCFTACSLCSFAFLMALSNSSLVIFSYPIHLICFCESKYTHIFLKSIQMHMKSFPFSSLSKNAQAERNGKSYLYEFADCRGAAVVL